MNLHETIMMGLACAACWVIGLMSAVWFFRKLFRKLLDRDEALKIRELNRQGASLVGQIHEMQQRVIPPTGALVNVNFIERWLNHLGTRVINISARSTERGPVMIPVVPPISAEWVYDSTPITASENIITHRVCEKVEVKLELLIPQPSDTMYDRRNLEAVRGNAMMEDLTEMLLNKMIHEEISGETLLRQIGQG